jgi:hypothetical protein
MGKVNSQEPYRGHDKVRTANGSGMPITHVGQASPLSSTSRRLHLCNVLCVPLITRNLISVCKFTYDNEVFCEFHLFYLLIKDRVTREVLLRGRVHQVLYVLEAPPAPEVFSGVRVSSAHWHTRLGHPASPIVSHVLHRHVLPMSSSNKSLAVCDTCQQGKSHQQPFVSSTRVVNKPLELAYSDVWGPAQTCQSSHILC